MRKIYQVSDFIDSGETDTALKCYQWGIDFYIFAGQDDKVLRWKWRKVAYLQSGY